MKRVAAICDVADRDAVAALAAEVEERLGPGPMRTGSHLAAVFEGDRPELEYALFAPLASSPPTALRAERAARRIAAALRRGLAPAARSTRPSTGRR